MITLANPEPCIFYNWSKTTDTMRGYYKRCYLYGTTGTTHANLRTPYFDDFGYETDFDLYVNCAGAFTQFNDKFLIDQNFIQDDGVT